MVGSLIMLESSLSLKVAESSEAAVIGEEGLKLDARFIEEFEDREKKPPLFFSLEFKSSLSLS